MIHELDEVNSKSTLLGACRSCPALQSAFAEKNSRLAILEKAFCNSSYAECALCPGLIQQVEVFSATEIKNEEEIRYIRTMLSWVSCWEPQLGMMICQFKRGVGQGLGFAVECVGGDKLHGK